VRRDRLRAVPLLGSSTTGSTASGAPRHSRRRAECELAVSSARLLDLAHFRSFALTQLGQLTTGNLLGAKTLLEEAIEEAENAGAGWFIAFANVALADVRRQQETRQTPSPYFKRSSIGVLVPLPAEVVSRSIGASQTILSSMRQPRDS
jgi:hypothetical protein